MQAQSRSNLHSSRAQHHSPLHCSYEPTVIKNEWLVFNVFSTRPPAEESKK